jgi:hypothetical protein
MYLVKELWRPERGYYYMVSVNTSRLPKKKLIVSCAGSRTIKN